MEKEVKKEKHLKSDKRQTEILIGLALIIIGILILFIALQQPRLNKSSETAADVSYSFDYSSSNKAVQTDEFVQNSEENIQEISVINLNACSAEDLMKLKGIGESKANAIIAYRNVIGSYSDTEEIKNISGISDKLYESIKDYITV